jgi:hypothetical protein
MVGSLAAAAEDFPEAFSSTLVKASQALLMTPSFLVTAMLF